MSRERDAFASHQYADERITQWLSKNQYHPRSDNHGKALCLYFLQDLLHESNLLRKAAKGRTLVCFEDFVLGEGALRWKTDLVIGPPLEAPLVQKEAEIARGKPKEIWLAIDAKSVMTEHGKARKNRQRDLDAFASIVKKYYPRCVVAGLILLNMATHFKSPLRKRITDHRNMERIVSETIDIFNEIPRASIESGNGIESVGVIVVDHTNDPKHKTSLIKDPPAPQRKNPANYRNTLQIIKLTLENRFFT